MKTEEVNEQMPSGVAIVEEKASSKEGNIFIVINREVLTYLKRYDLNINQLFVLLALYEEYTSLLDTYDEDFKLRKVIVEDYQHLYIHGLMVTEIETDLISADTMRNSYYTLTSKGIEVVEGAKVLFELGEPQKEEEEDLRTLAKDYLELWPKMKLPSGVYARVSSVEIEKKLKSFIKAYKSALKRDYSIKLDRELILEATKAYIERFAKKDYNFMVNSSYFIQKREKSALADEIIAMKQGTNKPSKGNFVNM